MKTLSILELFELFGTEEIAEDWFIEARWPNGVRCAFCDGEKVGERGNHPVMRFHCLDCSKFFSVKSRSVMESSKLSYKKWAIAIYMFVTRPKGISAHQLRKDLGVTHKTAWHLAHRIRKALADDDPALLYGPVEVDETFVGGRARNQPMERKRRLSKVPVIGILDRATNRVLAEPIDGRNSRNMQGFVYAHTDDTTEVYTDDASGYRHMARRHTTVNHSLGEYGLTNRIEGFWSLLKRAYMGNYHKMSPKHLHRYTAEMQERHNRRPMDAIDMMKSVVTDGVGKRLRLVDLMSGYGEYPPAPPNPKPTLAELLKERRARKQHSEGIEFD